MSGQYQPPPPVVSTIPGQTVTSGPAIPLPTVQLLQSMAHLPGMAQLISALSRFPPQQPQQQHHHSLPPPGSATAALLRHNNPMHPSQQRLVRGEVVQGLPPQHQRRREPGAPVNEAEEFGGHEDDEAEEVGVRPCRCLPIGLESKGGVQPILTFILLFIFAQGSSIYNAYK